LAIEEAITKINKHKKLIYTTGLAKLTI